MAAAGGEGGVRRGVWEVLRLRAPLSLTMRADDDADTLLVHKCKYH